MKDKNIACVFPETLPDERLLFPLVPVFDQVVYMQAVENAPPEHGRASAFVEQCRQLGRLHYCTPAPLGDQRQRFFALVQDLRSRGADYINQLGMLTLAGLNRRDQRESKHSILAELLGQQTVRDQKEQELLLWQSRLIVQLGEMYDLQQTDLNQALRQITHRQETLLAELREEEDNPFSLTADLHATRQETDGILRHRLKAWGRLCLHAPDQPQGLPVTRHQAALDMLLEAYEQHRHHSPSLSATLELPAHTPASGQGEPVGELLVEQCPGIRTVMEKITRPVRTEAVADETIKLLQGESAAQWAQLLETRYPASSTGRSCLELYYFPEISTRHLLRQGLIGDNAPMEKDRTAPTEGCFIGLLRGTDNT